MSDQSPIPDNNAALAALRRFREALVGSVLKPAQSTRPRKGGAKPIPAPVIPAAEFHFRPAPQKKTILCFRDGENRPSIRISCGYKYLNRENGIFRLLVHLAVMKKFRAPKELQQIIDFISQKGENNCVFYQSSGVPSLHARRSESARLAGEPRRIGIGSAVENQSTGEQGVIGGFVVESLAATAGRMRKIYLLSAGHVFSYPDPKSDPARILHSHLDKKVDVVAQVEKFVSPKTIVSTVADYGIALKYPDVDYSPYGLGGLGELLGHYSEAELTESDEFLVAKIERPSDGDFKTARFVGVLQSVEFEVGDDLFAEIDSVVLLEWESKRFSKKGDSGSLIVSVETKRAVGTVIGSRKSSLAKTQDLSYVSLMDVILRDSGLMLEVRP